MSAGEIALLVVVIVLALVLLALFAVWLCQRDKKEQAGKETIAYVATAAPKDVLQTEVAFAPALHARPPTGRVFLGDAVILDNPYYYQYYYEDF